RDKLERAKALISSLPATHPWRHHRLYRDVLTTSEADVYDLFLHSQDRAYTVPELHDWIERRAGLHMIFNRTNVGPLAYQPRAYIGDPALLAHVETLPAYQQAAIGELMAGDMFLHSFFATRLPDTVA